MMGMISTVPSYLGIAFEGGLGLWVGTKTYLAYGGHYVSVQARGWGGNSAGPRTPPPPPSH